MTRRQQIIQILKEKQKTIKQLADQFEAKRAEIENDLTHIQKSVKASGLNLEIGPAQCERCDFTFKERTRIRKPSKCPMCKSEAITEPRFSIG